VSRDKDALLDMLEMIDLIEEHGPRDEQTLRDDLVRQAATLRWLQIIGEAANKVSPQLRAAHPEVAWRGIIGTRNVVAHGYDRVKLDVVWNVIEQDLPDLRRQIAAFVDDVE
jgi:uncharacterized protein with HEPN domain